MSIYFFSKCLKGPAWAPPLQATLFGHTPNAEGISAKKGDFFEKFLSNSKRRAFK